MRGEGVNDNWRGMMKSAGYNNKSVLILILEIALAVGVAGVMVYWIVKPARKRGQDGGDGGGGGAKQ